MNNLEELIKLSKIVARPWFIATVLLAILLIISICGNIYQATKGVSVTFDADNNIESTVNQTNG